jgi:patatin-like phospholipase/acyl hydrolase
MEVLGAFINTKAHGQTMAYRILSLDGGGTWALIQVKALLDLYGTAVTGHQILQDFDLVAANSGGSIVLGGLIEDYPLEKLLSLFQDEHQRTAIFSATGEVATESFMQLPASALSTALTRNCRRCRMYCRSRATSHSTR